jgi:Carboxypeptidase regulatory-like domain
VLVTLKTGTNQIASAQSDDQGRVTFTSLKPAHYEIQASKDGFDTGREPDLDLTQGAAPFHLTVVLSATRKDSVEVRETVTPVDQSSSAPTSLPVRIAKDLPIRPATVSDALPLLPGIARSPGGGLQLSGSGEHRSALIVNSADVTDPATGQFGLTVPIDKVESVNFYQTPFLAEFGQFTAGLVSVETRRGGDKWKWDLNDPFPEFFIRSYQVRGLRTATPRLNFEGPLLPGKLFFSEGIEYQIRKTPVFTLPFPDNLKKQEGVNAFAQFDWIVSQNQLVTATVHVAPQRLQYVNMDFFNPQSTAPDAATHNYTVTLGDHLALGGGLLQTTLSATQFDARVWGQGLRDLNIAPGGNTGNYFSQQNRQASRLGLSSIFSLAPLTLLGTHNVKVGSYVADSSERGQAIDHPINILDSANQLLERITFSGGQPFHVSDTGFALFGQDHWILSPKVAFDLGLRAESQQISETLRFAPRAGVVWNPFANSATVVRAGVGLFYDRVPLNVYSFDSYPNQIVTMYGGAGQIISGPFVYQNRLGQVSHGTPFVFQELTAGNFSPRSTTWSTQVEQQVAPFLKLRLGYMQNQSVGLVLLNQTAPDPVTQIGANLLSGTGQSRYRQFEITTKIQLKAEGQLFLSYVRSKARGDLNDYAAFLGSFPAPLIHANQFSDLPTDLPNRFLAWGVMWLPLGFQIGPSIEYRNGFPYVVADAAQNYVGVPNQSRFPAFFSVDSRFSKDFKVSPKYTVRLSVSAYNLSNHFNPEAVHANIGDPARGLFFGDRGRHFTADFDILF